MICVGRVYEDDYGYEHSRVKFVFDNLDKASSFVNAYNDVIQKREVRIKEIEEKIEQIKDAFLGNTEDATSIYFLDFLKTQKNDANNRFMTVCKTTRNHKSPEAVCALNSLRYIEQQIIQEQKRIEKYKKVSHEKALRSWYQEKDAILEEKMPKEYEELKQLQMFQDNHIQILDDTVLFNPQFDISLLE